MKKETEKTLILILGTLFIFLIILGFLYPALERIENSNPSKNVSVNKSNSLFDFNRMFDFSEYSNLSLGEICYDLEDCISFCSENIEICDDFCRTNPENELCKKVTRLGNYIEENNLTEEDIPEELRTELEDIIP